MDRPYNTLLYAYGHYRLSNRSSNLMGLWHCNCIEHKSDSQSVWASDLVIIYHKAPMSEYMCTYLLLVIWEESLVTFWYYNGVEQSAKSDSHTEPSALPSLLPSCVTILIKCIKSLTYPRQVNNLEEYNIGWRRN